MKSTLPGCQGLCASALQFQEICHSVLVLLFSCACIFSPELLLCSERPKLFWSLKTSPSTAERTSWSKKCFWIYTIYTATVTFASPITAGKRSPVVACVCAIISAVVRRHLAVSFRLERKESFCDLLFSGKSCFGCWDAEVRKLERKQLVTAAFSTQMLPRQASPCDLVPSNSSPSPSPKTLSSPVKQPKPKVREDSSCRFVTNTMLWTNSHGDSLGRNGRTFQWSCRLVYFCLWNYFICSTSPTKQETTGPDWLVWKEVLPLHHNV